MTYLGSVSGGEFDKGASLAVSVLISEDGALLNSSIISEYVPDFILSLLFSQHSHKQFPVLTSVGLIVSWFDLQRSVHAWQCDFLMESSLTIVCTLACTIGQEGTAFVHPCELVFEHGELINLTKLFKHWSQIVVLEVAGNLTDKQLDSIIILLSFRFFVAIVMDR